MGKKHKYPDGYYKCSKCGEMLPLTREYFTLNSHCSTGFSTRCKKCRGFKNYGFSSSYINKELSIKGLKKCKYCGRVKPISNFFPVGTTRLSEHCNDCINQRKLEKSHYDKENYKIIKERKKEYYNNWKLNGGNEIRNENEHNRLNRIKNLDENFTDLDWKNCLRYFNYSCAYCGKTREEQFSISGFDLIKEHVVPVSRGGGMVPSNIIPSCNICNSKKKDKNLKEYFEYENFGADRLEKIKLYLKSFEEIQEKSFINFSD